MSMCKDEALVRITSCAPCQRSSKNPLVHYILTAPAFVQKSSGLITALSLSLFISFLLQVKQMVLQITHQEGAGEEMVEKENIIGTDKDS